MPRNVDATLKAFLSGESLFCNLHVLSKQLTIELFGEFSVPLRPQARSSQSAAQTGPETNLNPRDNRSCAMFSGVQVPDFFFIILPLVHFRRKQTSTVQICCGGYFQSIRLREH